MIDLHLRAESETDLKSALPWAVQRGEWVTTTGSYALDLIGPLELTHAMLDEDGNVVVPADVDGRFHANLRLLDEFLVARVPDSITVDVSTPRRVWA